MILAIIVEFFTRDSNKSPHSDEVEQLLYSIDISKICPRHLGIVATIVPMLWNVKQRVWLWVQSVRDYVSLFELNLIADRS